jgi:HAMP domain-containing protein
MAARSPTLAAIEAEAAQGPDELDAWFEVLAQYEPIRSRAEALTDEEKRLVVLKFRLLRTFEKHIMAEFRLADIAGYLIPPDGYIRSRVCLAALKALMRQAVRRGRRKGDFESLERPTHRVDSTCYELRPPAMRQDEVDEVEMAFRKLFTLVDGRTAEVQEIEQALRDLYELRAHDVLVEDPPPPPERLTRRAREQTVVSAPCPNPDCAARLRVPAKYAGRRARCPKCGQPFTVPAGSG